jgi:hypothetical protein
MKDVLQGSVPLPSPKRDALAQQAAYYSSFTPHLPPTFDSPIPEAPSSYSSLAQDRTSHLHPILTLRADRIKTAFLLFLCLVSFFLPYNLWP